MVSFKSKLLNICKDFDMEIKINANRLYTCNNMLKCKRFQVFIYAYNYEHMYVCMQVLIFYKFM